MKLFIIKQLYHLLSSISVSKKVMFTSWTISNPIIKTSDVFADSDIAPEDRTTQRQILQFPYPGQRRVQLSRGKAGTGGADQDERGPAFAPEPCESSWRRLEESEIE